MFPIRDLTGRSIAFGGRTLSKEKKVAKYFDSPESILYHKGDVLFGMHLAKPAIAKEDRVLLVEATPTSWRCTRRALNTWFPRAVPP